MFIQLTPQIAVFGQIEPAAVADAAALGITTIINNRPDAESPGQPEGDSIRAAAQAAGLRYVAIPVDQGGFNMGQVEAMAAELETGAKVLAFCRSGTRSTNLWALAEAKRGGDVDAIVAAAAGGGYNVQQLVPMMRQLAGG